MPTLIAKKRDTRLKPRQLRRNGIIPGVLYGKDLEESVSVQFAQADAVRFLQFNAAGSKVQLELDGKKRAALLREATYRPATDELEHLSFQTLLANEVITSTARIVLANRERVLGIVQHHQAEISYRALPAHLVEIIEIDLEGLHIGASMRVGDLDMASSPDIELLTPLDSMVFSIVEARRVEETEETVEEEEVFETEGE